MNPFRTSESAHWYHSDGRPSHDSNLRDARKHNLFFSVTSILKMWPRAALDAWKINNAISLCLANPKMENEDDHAYKSRIAGLIEANLNDAARWGRTIHAMFEQYAHTQTFGAVTEEFAPYAPVIEQWFTDNVLKVRFSERILVSDKHGFAGTCDLAIDSKDWGVAICDFKRRGFRDGKPNVYDTDAMQLRAYSECTDFHVDSLVSVAVNRDEPVIHSHVWPQKKYTDHWNGFMACYRLMCRVKRYMPQVQFDLPLGPIQESSPPPKPKRARKKRAKRVKKPVQMQFEDAQCQTTTPYADIIP